MERNLGGSQVSIVIIFLILCQLDITVMNPVRHHISAVADESLSLGPCIAVRLDHILAQRVQAVMGTHIQEIRAAVFQRYSQCLLIHCRDPKLRGLHGPFGDSCSILHDVV